jgi:hypothetical protein
MINRFMTALAIAALAVYPATAALAADVDTDTGMDQNQTQMGQPQTQPMPGQREEVQGLRLVPSIVARDVNLTPSAWIMRDKGQNASASARVYQNADGAITGLTLTAWGMPNPESINPRFNNYVVWLVDTNTNKVKNIGMLESHNGGKVVFGYEPDTPLTGYNRIAITPEPTFATGWPVGWNQMQGDIPQPAMAPTMTPGGGGGEPTMPDTYPNQ